MFRGKPQHNGDSPFARANGGIRSRRALARNNSERGNPMLGRLWKKKVESPTAEQLRKAKGLAIKSASEMSRASLAVLIAEAEKKRAAEK
jgi:hypothetical protein